MVALDVRCVDACALVAEQTSAHSGKVCSVGLSPDGTRIVSGSDDASVKVCGVGGARSHCAVARSWWLVAACVRWAADVVRRVCGVRRCVDTGVAGGADERTRRHRGPGGWHGGWRPEAGGRRAEGIHERSRASAQAGRTRTNTRAVALRQTG
eukprot:2678640-Prymnesium_polylepis.1